MKRPRVLIVDDESCVVDPMQMLLSRSGIDVDAFTDPTEALSNFRQGTYDLIVLDIKMPRMDGFHLYRELRKVDKDVRICFLTAFDVGTAEFKTLFPDMEVCTFFTKPVEIDEIVKEVRQKVLV